MNPSVPYVSHRIPLRVKGTRPMPGTQARGLTSRSFTLPLTSSSKYSAVSSLMIAAACTVMSYAMYTVSEKAVHSFGTTELIWTVPFVLYGLFRYLFLIHRRNSGGNPARVLLTDPPLMIDIVLWLAACCAIIYHH